MRRFADQDHLPGEVVVINFRKPCEDVPAGK